MNQSKYEDPALARATGWIVHEVAPDLDHITLYDRVHFLTYARLQEADRAGVPWQEGAREILRCDVAENVEHARRCWETHLARACAILSGTVGG